MHRPPVVGRERERAILAGLLEDVHQRGAALIVRGEPGIGKPALLAEASGATASRGMLVLATSGVQSEAVSAATDGPQVVTGRYGCIADRGLPAPARGSRDQDMSPFPPSRRPLRRGPDLAARDAVRSGPRITPMG